MQELSKRESERLADLQRDAGAAPSGYGRHLTMADLVLVLRHDPALRALVADIARQPARPVPGAATPQAAAAPAPDAVQALPPVAPAVPDDRLREGLAGPLRLLALLERDTALRAEWLGNARAGDGAGLARLVAIAAQWDRIEALWDVLAQRCKHGQRAATTGEASVLEESVRIHNLIWDGRQAAMVMAAAGAGFDFSLHERGNAAGQQVSGTWLPGLKNAAGQLRKKALVHTG